MRKPIRRQLSAIWRAQDVALAVATTALGQFSILAGYTHEGPKLLTAPVAFIVTAGLAWRRRAPMAAATVAMCAWLLQAFLARSPSALWELIPLLVYPYSVAAYEERRRALIGGGIILVAVWVTVLLDPGTASADRAFTAPVLVGAPWLAGRAARRYASQARHLDEAKRELELRREVDILDATREERSRIARELHDVVAHSLSVMVVQAGAAESLLATDPAEVAEPLASIRRTGKSALHEMRRLLGVLRTDPDSPALEPQPGARELPVLTEELRRAGLEAHLALDPEFPELPPGPDLVVYRVVQEALTNTLKHAGKVRVDVAVRHDSGSVEIDVLDRGGKSRSAPDPGQGHGLVGMRERVALYGGSLSAGPVNGGWRVHVRLPIEEGP